MDDDEDGRDLMSTVLVTAGFRVDTAANGRLALLALELMAEGEPALIILDVMMPVMSGPEVLRVLHDTGRLSSLSVIVLSATPELAHGLGAARNRSQTRSPRHACGARAQARG